MAISFTALWSTGAAYTMLILLLFSLHVACLQDAETRCNPNQIGHNAASQKCPSHQICTPRGICEPLRQAPVVARERHFMPIPSSSSQTPILAKGRCGKHFGGVKCDLNSKRGPCCSSRGWCGSSPAHCLPDNGCQHGCIIDPPGTIHPREVPAKSKEQTSEPLINTHQIFASFGKPLPAPDNDAPGQFKIVGDSGVPAMHAALMPNGKVVFLDKIENYTQLHLDNGEFAYSSEWDPVSGAVTPLGYKVCSRCHWLFRS